MKNDPGIVQELKKEEKQGKLFSLSKESSKSNTSDQNLDHTCFKNFFENAPIYEYMLSPDGTILEINKTACKNLGYKKEELIGKHLTAIYAPESHEKMKVLLPKWKETGEIDNEEMVIETKQGEKRRVLLSASSIRGADGTILYFISVLKDVTEINKMYDELNKNLWLQNVKLQKLNETKKTFLKTTSHELRTPITSIKGYVQMLMKKTLGGINDEQMKSLEVILRNTNRLDQVIQNILDASNLESGSMKFIPRKVSPRLLVEEITKMIEPFANKKEMTIHVNLEKNLPDLIIDGERIKQVLMNLVDNAIKFSPNGSKIYIGARKEKEDILFEVQDFGQGIPKDKQGKIFESFYQADSGDDRKFGGAGLSLALCRGIVGLHGGKIWFESTEGTGTTFLFTIPIQPISDRENEKLNDERSWENILEKSADLTTNSVSMNTTDDETSCSNTKYEKSTTTPKENEERYQALFNSSLELVYLHDLNGNFINANPTALRLLGYSKEDLSLLNFSSLLGEGQIWKAMKTINEIKQYGYQKEPTEYRLKTKDGTFIDVETFGELMYRDGMPYAIQGIAHNITEQKQAKQIVKESIERYRILFENAPDLIIETDDKGNILAMNPKMAKNFGVPAEKFIGKNIYDIFPKEVAENRAKIARKALEEMKNQESQDERAGRYFHNIYVPVVHPDGNKTIQTIVRDITDQKKAEDALKSSEAQLSNAVKIAHLGPWEYDVVNDLFMFNDAFYTIFHTTVEQVGGYTMSSVDYAKRFVHPDDAPLVGLEVRKAIETDDPHFNNQLEHRIIYPDGGVGYISVRFFIIKDEKGRTIRTYGVNQDITERKKVEEKIKIFSDAIASAFDCILLTDLRGNITFANESAINAFGYTSEEFLKLNITELDADPTVAKKVMQDIAVDKRWSGEVINIRKNKEKFPAILSAFIIKDDKGNPTGTMGIIKDITERKKIGQDLRDSKALVDAVVENVPLMIFLKEATDLRFIIFNRAGEELLGHDREELLGKNNLDLFPPEQAANFMAKDREVLDGKVGMLDIPEEPILTAKKGQRLLHTRKVCIQGPDGVTKFLLGISEDITERKQTEKTLRESEEKFRLLFNDSPLGIALVDPEGIIKEVNNKLLQLLSIKKEEFIGKNFIQLTSAYGLNTQEQTSDFKNRITGKPSKKEITFLSKDNKKVTLTVQSSIIKSSDKIIGILFILEDVTELKQAEEELRESETLLNDVSGMVHVGGWELDIETKEVHWTKETYRIHDISPDEKFDLSKAVLFFDLPDRTNLEASLQRGMKAGESFDLVLPFTSAKGRHLWTRAIGRAVKNDSGKVVKLIGTFQDITERKKVEKELKESEEKYRNVVEQASDGIVIIQDLVIKYANPRAFNILGYDPAAMIGSLMTDYVHPNEVQKIVEYYNRRIAGNDAPRAYESVLLHKDGREINVELGGHVITYQEKPADMILVHDITERKKAEKDLKEKISQLEQYKKITVDRELKMIEMKKEINGFCRQLNQKPRYAEV